MRILLATMQYGPGYGQGTERYLSILRTLLPQHGCSTLVLAGDPENRFPAAETAAPRDFDDSVHSLPSFGWMAIHGRPVEELRATLRRLSPDLVHIANPAHIGLNLVRAATDLDLPVVLTTMDFWWVCPKQTLLRRPGGDVAETCRGAVDWRTCLCCIANERPGSWRARLGQLPVLGHRLVPPSYLATWRRRGLPAEECADWPRRGAVIAEQMNLAGAVIFPSQATHERIAPLLSGPRTYRIPYGLEPRWFGDAGRRPRPAQRADLRIGYAGALDRHKGVHTLLAAADRAGWHDVEIRIAGAGPADYLESLHQRARGLNVTFCGRVPTDEMPAWLADLDLLVMPSLWPENLPIITLEAAAVGTPLLCSDIEGVVELVPPEARFRPDDPVDLARQLDNWWRSETWPTPARVTTAEEMTAATFAIYRGLVPG